MTAPAIIIPALPQCRKGHEIPGNVTHCVVCAEPVGFPNVRYAERKEEISALGKRLADARISASAKGSLARLESFGRAVAASKAVVCRDSGDLDVMLRGDGQLMQAYHPAVRAGLRVPSNNKHDPKRDMNDSRVSPHFYDRIHFAALSLDRRGVPHYGNCAITLRSDMIHTRTTVFEENPVVFVQKHPIDRSDTIPFGYRAVWDNRDMLAMAKLQPRIDAETPDTAFPVILMEDEPVNTEESDFMEVHVYGDVHPGAFEHVIADIPDDPYDKLLWERMKIRLDQFGVSYEELTAVDEGTE